MVYAFILMSGWLFWTILIAVTLLEIALLSTSDDHDDGGWPTFIAVCVAAGVALFTDALTGITFAMLAWIAAGYFVFGVIWSIKKWFDYVTAKRDSARRDYDRDYIDKTVKGNETFEQWSERHKPRASAHKRRITAWMALWPFSFSWWVLTWPRRAFAWLYDRISGVFDRITDRVWGTQT